MAKPTEAVGLIDRVLQEGKTIGDHNAIAEALILKARVLSGRDLYQAIAMLETAISISEKNHFRRTLVLRIINQSNNVGGVEGARSFWSIQKDEPWDYAP